MAHGGVNLNLNFRTNDSPETLLKELILSPLIYLRLVGVVSWAARGNKAARHSEARPCWERGIPECAYQLLGSGVL